jgi:hypothetical protein
MIWKIIFQVLAVLTALLIAQLDYFWYDRRTLKFKRARIALFAVSLLLLLVSLVITIQDEQDNEREITELHGRLDTITNQLTGGDSYSYIQFGFPVGSDNQILVWLANDGDYPLYDVQIRMVDLYKFHNLQWEVPMPVEEIKKAETLTTFGVIGPHTIAELGSIKTPAELDAYGFNIWIHTRYKEFVQEARFKRFGGRWRLAHRLFEQTDQGKKLIFEKISNEFLNTDSAQDIWEFTSVSK